MRLFLTGSTATSSGSTTMRAGSLLDDNQWHDVEIDRNGREVNFTVDRLTITNMTNGDFFQLDIDRYVSCLYKNIAQERSLVFIDRYGSC